MAERETGQARAWPPLRAGSTTSSAGHASVLSFDVFDTTLTRVCGPPEAVFLWLGRRLWLAGTIPHPPEAFARTRMRAEQDVWTRAGSMDAPVSLRDFYREVAQRLWIDPRLVTALVEAELALEEEVVRPVPAAMRRIDRARRDGQSVVFTTDTYFAEEFVTRQLRRVGAFPTGARCLASSTFAASKASGRLFEHVPREAGVPADRVLHLGDNPHSDVRMPRRNGVPARLQPEARLNGHERVVAEHMWETGGLAAALAGASRQARLHTPASTTHQQAIRDVGAGVAAPVIVAYTLWVLQRAHELGVDRLFFLARDGQVMADVARQLAPRLGVDIAVSYLYVSRLSTNLAATVEASPDELGWVARDREFLSAEGVLRRLGISWHEAASALEPLGLPRDQTGLSTAAIAALTRAVRSGPLRDLLLERAATRRGLVTDYLRQEGVLDAARAGIVDFGGVGSQVRAVHTLTTCAGSPAPRIFLIGLDRPSGDCAPEPTGEPLWLRDTECYLYDHRRGRGIRRPRGFGTCVQMFCAADHDTVVGYRRRDGGVVEPVLAGDSAAALAQWGLPTLRAAIHEVVEHLTLDSELVDTRGDLRTAVRAATTNFWSSPSRSEARAWGRFPFEGAQAESAAATPLAAAYSWGSVMRGVRNRTFPDLGWQHWHEASVRLSGPVLRRCLELAESVFWRLDEHPSRVARSLGRLVRTALDRR